MQAALRDEAWTDSGLEQAGAPVGAVYTPRPLADWVAGLVLRELSTPKASIWDVACGEGALLAAVERAAPGRHALVGVDVDASAVRRARRALPRARFVHTDALSLLGRDPVHAVPGAATAGRPDGIVLNPPWSAARAQATSHLQRLGYGLARGQFDTYELFLELSLALLADGGVAAFIVPDSLLNTEHQRTRELLLRRSQLLLVARLGEGFFPSVYRGTLVVVVRNTPAGPAHRTRCLRLNAGERRAVLAGSLSLAEVERRRSHGVPQARFVATSHARFDLDVREHERATIEKIEACEPMSWRDWLASGRGVELSKRGDVLLCPACELALPKPRVPRVVDCRGCGLAFDDAAAATMRIVEPVDGASRSDGEWRPLIVGEDVRRYTAIPSRRIRTGLRGIAYKSPATFAAPKLVVRKTGVGLNVAVDGTGALTTQVVFNYTRLASSPPFMLEFLAGVLNSRLLLAYHLRTRGDFEWRSHPYVTQRVIEELPVPRLREGTSQWAQAQAIAEAVRARPDGAPPASEADLRIERLVLGLYRLDADDWGWTLRALQEAQALEGIRELRLPDAAELRAIRVAG
jgi:adenine-specific DNA-methyltransferase